MQGPAVETLWLLIAGSFTLLFFASAYFFLTVRSNTRIRNTERMKLEEVSRSEEKFRSLFENSLAGIVRFSTADWTVSDSNRAVRSIFRCSTNAELGMCLASLPPSALVHIKETIGQHLVIDQYEIHGKRRTGEQVWILFSATALDGKQSAQAVLIDITERKLFEEKIREQGALLNQADDAFIVIDMEGAIKSWSAGGESLYGWQEDEALGRRIEDLLYSGEHKESFASAMADVCQFNEWRGEQLHTRKDGKEILVEGRWKTIELNPDGNRRILVVATDITEKRRIEARIARAQRTETIAVLTGGLAHDLQNILTPVKMSARLLKKRGTAKSGDKLVNAILERAKTGLELLKNILTYGKGTTIRNRRVSVRLVLQNALTSAKRSSRKEINFHLDTNRQTWSILGDENQLKQVFANLLLNARDAISGCGEVRVSAYDAETDDQLGETYPGADKGPYVVVQVSDSGTGIPPEDLDRIFEPFYTTKERSGGTGLGLSIAQGIVTSHKGYITVKSIPGKGTTVRVYLPAMRTLRP